MSLDGPRLDEKDCWLRHWGSGSPRDSVGRFGSSVCFGSVGLELESTEPAESAAGADYESGRLMVQGLTERTAGPDRGAAAAMPTGGKIGSADLCSCRFVGEKRQRRFFDEHGLGDGLSRPGRKIRPGDTLTKQRWFRHWGSGSPRDSVGRFGSSVCFGSVGLLARWADASADSGSAQ